MNLRTFLTALIQLSLCCALFAQQKVTPTAYPYHYVVKLYMYKDGITFNGTGILLDEHHVLTNAHNLYQKDSVKVMPGYSQSNPTPFGSVTSICEEERTVFIPPRFFENPKASPEDFAILKVEGEAIYHAIQQTSENTIRFETPDLAEKPAIIIAGYPCFRFFEFWRPKGCHECFKNETKKYALTDNGVLQYKMNTRGGSSGSPLFINKGGEYHLVGIHKSGSGRKNEGVFYTTERYAQIRAWME